MLMQQQYMLQQQMFQQQQVCQLPTAALTSSIICLSFACWGSMQLTLTKLIGQATTLPHAWCILKDFLHMLQLMSQVSMPGYDSQRWRGHGSTMPATGQIAPGMGHLSPSIGSHWYSSSLANSGSVNIGEAPGSLALHA